MMIVSNWYSLMQRRVWMEAIGISNTLFQVLLDQSHSITCLMVRRNPPMSLIERSFRSAEKEVEERCTGNMLFGVESAV